MYVLVDLGKKYFVGMIRLYKETGKEAHVKSKFLLFYLSKYIQ